MYARLSKKVATTVVPMVVAAGLFGVATPTALAAASPTMNVRTANVMLTANTALVISVNGAADSVFSPGGLPYDQINVASNDEAMAALLANKDQYQSIQIVSQRDDAAELGNRLEEFYAAGDTGSVLLTMPILLEPTNGPGSLGVKLGLADPYVLPETDPNSQTMVAYIKYGVNDAPDDLTNILALVNHGLAVMTLGPEDLKGFIATSENSEEYYVNSNYHMRLDLGTPLVDAIDKFLPTVCRVVCGAVQLRIDQAYKPDHADNTNMSLSSEERLADLQEVHDVLRDDWNTVVAEQQVIHEANVAKVKADLEQVGDDINTALEQVRDDINGHFNPSDDDDDLAPLARGGVTSDLKDGNKVSPGEVSSRVNAGIKKASDDFNEAVKKTSSDIDKTVKKVRAGIERALKPKKADSDSDAGSDNAGSSNDSDNDGS